jgi:hypothetical protein
MLFHSPGEEGVMLPSNVSLSVSEVMSEVNSFLALPDAAVYDGHAVLSSLWLLRLRPLYNYR